MQEVRIGDPVALIDSEATATVCALLANGGAERCNCIYCRNFARPRATVFPPHFRELLVQSGVDPNKEAEVFDRRGPFEDLVRPRGGWFYLVGELLQKGEHLVSEGEFQYWFQPLFPRPPQCFGSTVTAVEFSTKIPWLLEEPPG